MFLYPNRECRTRDPLGVKMMARRSNKAMFVQRGVYAIPNATYRIELLSGRVATFQHQHEAQRFKRRAVRSGNRLAAFWTVETVYRTAILEDARSLAELGEEFRRNRIEEAEYRRKVDDWWEAIDLRRATPTNPATYISKGIEL